jgi:hypothetical protein
MMDAFERRSQKPGQYAGRISMKDGDPGRVPLAQLHAAGYIVRVYLDGVEQKYCEAADPAKRWIKRTKVKSDGQPIIWNNEFQSEELTGDVVIRLERRAVSP